MQSRGFWLPSFGTVYGSFLPLLAATLAAGAEAASPVQPQSAPALTWQERVEADWMLAERLRVGVATNASTTTQDAAGGCDGVKDGQWGFHTAEAQEPWWQVDLGRAETIGRVIVWNRTDAAERAARLMILLSTDGVAWTTAYQHTKGVFFGVKDGQPLEVALGGAKARFLRVQLPGRTFLHLDEVEVFGTADPAHNLALGRPADQTSISQWSRVHESPVELDWTARTRSVLANCRRLIEDLGRAGVSTAAEGDLCAQLEEATGTQPSLFLRARALQRRLTLANPLLDFDTLLFTKRVPPSFNHMSDQYYGWWSKPGGGLFLLRDFKTATPREECMTDKAFQHPGSFLRPALSYDGARVLFAWCRYYPNLANESNKLDKANVPEDAFYHLFEMSLADRSVRQITQGKYDDFDGRYLPDGRMVFLSTRRGQFIQAGRGSAAQTMARHDLPDCYVRCGGGPERPVAVYTLHTMNTDGSDICAISPFEMFEWTPEIARDGTVLHSRWDYIDRDNMPYMGLWAINPDGSSPRIVFKNYTHSPHCTFEPKPVPGSHKIVFTASAHHAQTMGSLVLLDPTVQTEGGSPMTRLTPEVPFPEIEAWPTTSYANPWPLSERLYLVAWGYEGKRVPGPQGWNRWHAVQRPANGMDLYAFDAITGRELLWADPEIACGDPIPVRSREKPPVVASRTEPRAGEEGRFLLSDVYQGLRAVPRGAVKALRLISVPPKTHPTMNAPAMGITRDDPGKCVLGTVPVEVDGSAYFRAPAGVILFFQALDELGVAIQTMRSASHVQAGQTLSCVGCHEHRQTAPPALLSLAAAREPSRITVGPEGSWVFRFDQLVQPVLDRQCVSCHNPKNEDRVAARSDLTPARAYETLVGFGKPSLQEQVWAGYRRGHSTEGEGIAQKSALLSLLSQPGGHREVKLSSADLERLVVWMDAYAQRLGAFDERQERELVRLRKAWAGLLIERQPAQTAAASGTGSK
jgi:hypothetical protein